MDPVWVWIIPTVNWLNLIWIISVSNLSSLGCGFVHDETLVDLYHQGLILSAPLAILGWLAMWIIVIRLVRIECNRHNDQCAEMFIGFGLIVIALIFTALKPYEVFVLGFVFDPHPITC
jgi:hypothetical protein